MADKKIKNLLDNLRKPTNKEKPIFEGYLPDARAIFQFDDTVDLPDFEAFLIVAISECFKESQTDANNAKKRDACLVTLGLLDGCYHTCIDENGIDSYCDVEDRYVTYLEGDYCKISYQNQEKNGNYDIKDKKSKPRRALYKTGQRALEALAEHLSWALQCGQCMKYLDIGKEKYVSQNNDGQCYVTYPKPHYTLQNFLPDSAQITIELEKQSSGNKISENNLEFQQRKFSEELLLDKGEENPLQADKTYPWIKAIAIGLWTMVFILLIYTGYDIWFKSKFAKNALSGVSMDYFQGQTIPSVPSSLENEMATSSLQG